MEKITIAKIVKVRDSKFGKNVMLKANEHPDRIYMVNVKEESSLVVGKVIEGDTELWKKGEDVEFWSFKWPKKTESSSMSDTKLLYISRNVDATLASAQMLIAKLDRLVQRLEAKGVLDDISEGTKSLYPTMTAEPNFETIEEPPLEAYEQ